MPRGFVFISYYVRCSVLLNPQPRNVTNFDEIPFHHKIMPTDTFKQSNTQNIYCDEINVEHEICWMSHKLFIFS